MPDEKAPAFSNLGEIEHALNAGALHLHDKIRVRRQGFDAQGSAASSAW